MLRQPRITRQITLSGVDGGAADKILYGVLGLFVVVLVVLVAAVFVKPDAPQFEPSPVRPVPIEQILIADTITVDAASAERWQYFDFDRQSVVDFPDTAGWDLAFRRFNVIVSGEAQDLSVKDFALVTTAPMADYTPTTVGRDTVNAAVDRWYTYGMVSHMLRPKENVYAVRTTDGNYAKVQFLSYYCPGLIAGCVTFRYAYRSDGQPNFN